MQLLSLKCFVLATHEQACYIITNKHIYIYTHYIHKHVQRCEYGYWYRLLVPQSGCVMTCGKHLSLVFQCTDHIHILYVYIYTICSRYMYVLYVPKSNDPWFEGL